MTILRLLPLLLLAGCEGEPPPTYSISLGDGPTICWIGSGPGFPARDDGMCYAEDAGRLFDSSSTSSESHRGPAR